MRPPSDPTGLWDVQTKTYAPALSAGQPLVFALRANAVVTHTDGEGRHSRHDVVMEAKTQLRRAGTSPDEWPSEPDLVQRATTTWLATRAERCGFAIAPAQIRADGYRQHRFRKSGGAVVRFSTVDLEGLLTVIDPDRFRAILFGGIGPTKGFGCGMVIVRKP